jgi:hypothetical protein
MKSFTEYLAESKKIYNFKIKVAGEIPEKFEENLKSRMEKCNLVKLEQITKTPIQKLPLDFPELKNMEVTVYEVICEYPITAPEIKNDLREMGLDEEKFRVRGAMEPSEIDQIIDQSEEQKTLLTDNTYGEAENAKHKEYFGDDYNKDFIKSLAKEQKQRVKDTKFVMPKTKEDKMGKLSAVGSKK